MKKKQSKAKPGGKADKYVVGRTLSTYSRKKPPAAEPLKKKVYEPTTESTKKFTRKRLMIAVFLLLLIPVLVIGAWDAINYSRASRKMFGSSNLLSALVPTSLKGSDKNRVNVLVVGYSVDDADHAGAELTDSIMIVSLSTDGKNSYMLSVPRDLYVAIADDGKAKINEAYQRGESSEFSSPGYPAGGIGLLEKTISENFGISIDYYALVNYAAVRGTTDALGGITVNIQSSDPRGIYDPNFQPHEGGPLRLVNGVQSIDGQTALRLTRARGAAGGYGLARSDFDRTKNQQEVFRAIKTSISTKMLLDPRKNSQFLDAVASNVRTDISVNEVLPFYRLFNGIPSTELDQISLREINGKNLLTNYTTPSGQAALIPAEGRNDFSDIQSVIQELNQ